MPGPRAFLIVNADDYGYFPCVSQGIVEAAQAGVVSATGLIANGPDLGRQIPWLRGLERLDLGVHLNLTSRHPLTQAMAEKLAASGGQFPAAFAMAGQILAGRIGLRVVRDEWRAQIETLLGHGLRLVFLNSHEHIHMLPSLFPVAQELASEYRIPHIRLTRAEWLPPFGFSSVLRSLLLHTMEAVNRLRSGASSEPLFIGLGRSGKLDLEYLQTIFARMRPGRAYELMCHPGRFDPAQISDRKLLAYHDWESELALLTGPRFKALCEDYGIAIINYRDFKQMICPDK